MYRRTWRDAATAHEVHGVEVLAATRIASPGPGEGFQGVLTFGWKSKLLPQDRWAPRICAVGMSGTQHVSTCCHFRLEVQTPPARQVGTPDMCSRYVRHSTRINMFSLLAGRANSSHKTGANIGQ